MRRKVIIFLAILVIVIGGVVSIAFWLLNDEAFLKRQVAGLVERNTGRQFRIEGPLEIEWGSEIRVTAGGVRLQNAPWAQSPDMLRLDHLEATLVTSSLFADRKIIPSLQIRGCAVEVLENEDGLSNWRFFESADDSRDETAETADELEGPALPIIIENASLDDCSLWLDSPERANALDLRIDEARLERPRVGRVINRITGSVNGYPLTVEGWLDPVYAFAHGGELRFELAAKAGDVTLESSGQITDVLTFSGPNIEARFHGPDIAPVIDTLALPPVSEGSFDFRLKLATVDDGTLVDIDGDLGSLDVIADGTVDRLIEPSKGKIEAQVKGPKLGSLAQAFNVAGVIEAPFSASARLGFSDAGVAIEHGVLETDTDRLAVSGRIAREKPHAGSRLSIDLEAEEVERWTHLIKRDARLFGKGRLSGTLAIDDAGRVSAHVDAALENNTLKVSASTPSLARLSEPDLEFDFYTDDLAKLLEPEGHAGLPDRSARIRGQLQKRGTGVRLTDITVLLDGSTSVLNGQLQLVPGFSDSEVTAAIDIPDTATYAALFQLQDFLPEGAGFDLGRLQIDGRLNVDVDGRLNVDGRASTAKSELSIRGSTDSLDRYDSLDAEIGLRSSEMPRLAALAAYDGFPDLPVRASGHVKLNDRNLRLEGVHLALGQAVAQGDATLHFEPGFPNSAIDARIDIPDVAAFGALFNMQNLPAERLQAGINVREDDGGVIFDLNDGRLGDRQLEFEGHIADLAQPLVMDAVFDLQLPGLQFLEKWTGTLKLPPGSVNARGRLVNRDERVDLEDVVLHVGEIRSEINGHFTGERRFDLDLAVSGPDVDYVREVTGFSLPEMAFSLSGHASGEPTSMHLKELNLAFGDSDVSGHLALGLGDTRKISGVLRSTRLDLDWIEKKEEQTAPTEQEKKSQWMFDETPVKDLAELGIEADLDIKIASLSTLGTAYKDIEVRLLLDPMRLQVGPFSLHGLWGGRLDGQVLMETGGDVPRIEARLDANEIRPGLFAAEGQDQSTLPPLDLTLDLHSRGQTHRALASNLDGTVRMHATAGQVARSGIGFLTNDFLDELLTTLNPFSKRSDLSQLDCEVAAADITSGQVALSPVVIQLREITIIADGQIDLNTEKMKINFNTKPRRGLGISAGDLVNPFIQVGGTLAQPMLQLNPAGTVVEGGLAVATAGISILAKSLSDRFLSSRDPCGDALKEIEKRDAR
ncbi:MAG: AsmA family protein [Lysobacterales bacterium]|jgi:uncharacterized protein involved in outer membrane biogenesis